MNETLRASLARLDEVLGRIQLPLPLDGVAEQRTLVEVLRQQNTDYLLPRVERLDAPLLAVVGGSTGAGKSTLVNALLGAVVSRTGVLRPTTKSPTLVCHPGDREWFRTGPLLGGLVRSDDDIPDSRALRVVATEQLSAGLAILDAPDIDSVDDANRLLSRQLLAAADLWIFVTTASRYADAVAWELLEAAAARDIVVAVVLNRCPPGTEADLTAHLTDMLDARGIRFRHIFALPEQEDLGAGLLTAGEIAPVRRWIGRLAAGREQRATVAVHSLVGAVRNVEPQLRTLAAAAASQAEAIADLREAASKEFRRASLDIGQATSDGSMLRGEVLSRWQDLVGTSDLMRALDKRIAALRDRLTGWVSGTRKGEQMQVAISDGVTALVVEHVTAACQDAAAAWARTPWGQSLISEDSALARPTAGFEAEVAKTVRAWQSDVLDLVENEGKGRRRHARLLAFGTNAVGAALIMVVFATTGGLTTAEVGIAGGTSVIAQRVLEGVFGDDAVRRLAKEAKQQLDLRVDDLLATQQARFETRLDKLGLDEELPNQLTKVADDLRDSAASAFDYLTRPEGY